MTPIVRGYVRGGKISQSGLHNLTRPMSNEKIPRGNYTAAMREIAKKYNVPLLDITKDTRKIVESYGAQAAKDYLYIPADSTHPRVLFATLIAKAATDDMKKLGILSQYIVQSERLVVSPSKLDWGKRYVKVPTNKKVTVSAFGLTPKKGTITISAPKGFKLADNTSSTNWSSTYTIKYTHGSFTQPIGVQFTATKQRAYKDEIKFVLSGKSLGKIDVKGEGVDVGEGITSYATWLTAPNTKIPKTDGLVTASDFTVSNLKMGSKRVMAVDGQDTTVARYRVSGPIMATRDDNRYLQFTVTSAKNTFNVSGISMYLASSGGSTVKAAVEYSLNKDFSHSISLNKGKPLSFPKNTMTKVSFGVTEQLAQGKTMYVRIFPWNTAGNNGKYLAIYDLKITGISSK